MHPIVAFISHHLYTTLGGSGVLLVALISCLPAKRPKTVDDWYAYVRDSLQTAVPAARHTPNPPGQDEPGK